MELIITQICSREREFVRAGRGQLNGESGEVKDDEVHNTLLANAICDYGFKGSHGADDVERC